MGNRHVIVVLLAMGCGGSSAPPVRHVVTESQKGSPCAALCARFVAAGETLSCEPVRADGYLLVSNRDLVDCVMSR